MNNADTRVAREFHAATKYTLVNEGRDDANILLGTPPGLKPAIGEQSPTNEPNPFKLYTALDPLALPHDFPPLAMPLLDAIAASGVEPAGRVMPDRDALARICLLSNGILKRGSHGTGRVIEYRAAGGTGARYHLELYIVCGDLPDLDAGVYHYSASDHSLRQLRTGDHRAALAEATGAEPSVVAAPAVLVATSTFWRNAWRYQERAYRHVYWDLGTTMANVLAVASASRVPSRIVMGFDDGLVNRLLGVDGEREATVCLVALGRNGCSAPAPELAALDHATRPVSASEIDFPFIRQMHAASSLSSGSAVSAWRDSLPNQHPHESIDGERRSLAPLDATELPAMPTDEAIRRRRSTRKYDPDAAISFAALSTLLDRSNRPVASDFLGDAGWPLTDQYLIVNHVDGLQHGTYAVDSRAGELQLLDAADFRSRAASVASGQDYAAAGQVNIYYLADLEPLLDAWGNRGYRIAQFEGALRAGKLHLATHTMGLGAVGSTSVDDEVTRLFSPHAAGKSFMFVLVFGKRRRTGG